MPKGRQVFVHFDFTGAAGDGGAVALLVGGQKPPLEWNVTQTQIPDIRATATAHKKWQSSCGEARFFCPVRWLSSPADLLHKPPSVKINTPIGLGCR